MLELEILCLADEMYMKTNIKKNEETVIILAAVYEGVHLYFVDKTRKRFRCM